MNKKAKVKMLLDIISNLKSIPTKSEHKMDMEKFYEMEQVKAVIILLKEIKVNQKYLQENQFVLADMMIGHLL